MRSIKIVTLVTLLTLGGLLMVNRAEALPLQGAAAIGIAAGENDLRQDVAYVCRRVWRCGRHSCGWRRSCYRTPGRYAYAYPYAYGYAYPYAYPYGYRYWRPYPRYWGYTWRGRRYWR